MKDSITDITIILPCAGSGSRLGLEQPKELFEILPGTCLIDLSLAHIRAAQPAKNLKVAVVIRPWKREVVDHVCRKLPGIKVETVFFNDSYHEWPGSVYSAGEFFSKYNLVLLPDSLLNVGGEPAGLYPACFDDTGFSLVELVSAALSVHKAVFGWIKCSEPLVLKKLGALRVEGGKVTAFQDKPGKAFENYNGFWGCFAFRKEVGESLYHFLVSSVRRLPVSLEQQPFHPVGSIRLHSYRDLGTWPTIGKFQQDYTRLPKI